MAVCAVTGAAAQNVSALDVTLSTSTTSSGLSGVLDQLMGVENASLSGLTASRLRHLASPYDAERAANDPRVMDTATLDEMRAPRGNAL